MISLGEFATLLPLILALVTAKIISNSLNVTNGVIGGGSSISGGAWTFVN